LLNKKGDQEMLSTIIVWILFGGAAGWLANSLIKRNAQMGTTANIVIGIIGAFIGGLWLNLFGVAGMTGFNLYNLLVAISGAVVLLFLLGRMSHNTT
jgi:uncharacterized membrane protein YeaQ/YmgE (transglycosylase-associated protein family)